MARKRKDDKGFIVWRCGVCGDEYDSPIPITGFLHPCSSPVEVVKTIRPMKPVTEEEKPTEG